MMIGNRLRELRKQRKMTQRELADTMQISASAVGMYEQNRREPPYDLLQKFSTFFTVTSDYLLFGEETVLNATNVPYRTKANDFQTIMDNLKSELANQKGLMFKGEILEEADIEKLFEAMKIGAEIALKCKE